MTCYNHVRSLGSWIIRMTWGHYWHSWNYHRPAHKHIICWFEGNELICWFKDLSQAYRWLIWRQWVKHTSGGTQDLSQAYHWLMFVSYSQLLKIGARFPEKHGLMTFENWRGAKFCFHKQLARPKCHRMARTKDEHWKAGEAQAITQNDSTKTVDFKTCLKHTIGWF